MTKPQFDAALAAFEELIDEFFGWEALVRVS
jgi:hypothetical protein